MLLQKFLLSIEVNHLDVVCKHCRLLNIDYLFISSYLYFNKISIFLDPLAIFVSEFFLSKDLLCPKKYWNVFSLFLLFPVFFFILKTSERHLNLWTTNTRTTCSNDSVVRRPFLITQIIQQLQCAFINKIILYNHKLKPIIWK